MEYIIKVENSVFNKLKPKFADLLAAKVVLLKCVSVIATIETFFKSKKAPGMYRCYFIYAILIVIMILIYKNRITI